MNVMQFVLILLFMAVSGGSGQAAETTCRTAECHARVGGTKNFHEPVKEGDCSACHKPVNPVHPLKGGKSFAPVAKNEALCYLCHDRFGKKKVVHFPVKDGECAYCHKPHGGVERYLLGVGSDQRELCYGCHDPAPFKRKFVHGPVAVGECTKCHNPHESNNKALLSGAVWETCLKCHVDVVKALTESIYIHTPVKSGPCTVCHLPHSGEISSLLKKTTPALCLDCHKKMDKQLKAKNVHKPLLQEGGCSTCHSTHFAKAKKLLSGDDKTICLACHGTDKLGNPPLKNIKSEIEGKKYLHGPIQKGGCKDCHDPHGNDNFRLLKGKYPADIYAPYKDGIYSFCLSCHEKNMLRFSETTIYTKFRNGKRNLHYVHVVNNRKGRTCRVCHQPHASNGVKLIEKENLKFGEWQIPINFNETSTGGSCAPGCHQAFEYDRDKPVVYGGAPANKKP
jgi:predicted CXXCH cytochrome family protein